jgi:hypothetical protein
MMNVQLDVSGLKKSQPDLVKDQPGLSVTGLRKSLSVTTAGLTGAQ